MLHECVHQRCLIQGKAVVYIHRVDSFFRSDMLILASLTSTSACWWLSPSAAAGGLRCRQRLTPAPPRRRCRPRQARQASFCAALISTQRPGASLLCSARVACCCPSMLQRCLGFGGSASRRHFCQAIQVSSEWFRAVF